MEKTYKFRIYPNKEQEEIIQKTFGAVRFVYNYFLALKKEKYNENKKFLGAYDCCKILTELKKKPEYAWLNEVENHALQQSLIDLENSYKNFFRELKRGNKPPFPKFKSKKNKKNKFRSPFCDNNIRIQENKIKVPKIGWVKFINSQIVSGKIKNITISQVPSGKYFICVCCSDVFVCNSYCPVREAIGVDMGIKNFASLSNGTIISGENFLKKTEKKIARLQRSLSRKPRGSARHNKAKERLCVAYEKISNQRKDFLQKTSTSLVRENKIIVIEDLSIKQLSSKHSFAVLLQDIGWGSFVRMLKYKTAWYGRKVIKINKYFPSSQLCSNCGYKSSEVKNLKIREWTCPRCGEHHDRDINAAKNILTEGLRILSEQN